MLRRLRQIPLVVVLGLSIALLVTTIVFAATRDSLSRYGFDCEGDEESVVFLEPGDLHGTSPEDAIDRSEVFSYFLELTPEAGRLVEPGGDKPENGIVRSFETESGGVGFEVYMSGELVAIVVVKDTGIEGKPDWYVTTFLSC